MTPEAAQMWMQEQTNAVTSALCDPSAVTRLGEVRYSRACARWRRELQVPHDEPVQQLVLPGWEAGACSQSAVQRRVRHLPRSPLEPSGHATEGTLFECYTQRLAARTESEKTRSAYLYQLRTILRNVTDLAGHPVTIAELFQYPLLLGRALIDDHGLTNTTRLSKWTLAQRRSAIRSLALLLRPELEDILGVSPHDVLDQALRLVAERVGTGYCLTGGRPRRRGGLVPTADELSAIIEAAVQEAGYRGLRNQAFLRILAETGTRVNALRTLDGSDCWVHPSGSVRLRLHEKGKTEAREVELSLETVEALRAYARAFNQLAVAWRAAPRVRLGFPGPVWRNSFRGCWPYGQIVAMLQVACNEGRTRIFKPHAIRRFFATDAASQYPRHVVALAGGWKGRERLDNHYIHPHVSDIWQKLAALEMPDASPFEQVGHATTAATFSIQQ